MPLSDHEQRLLEQMERALYAEDPKFADALRKTHRPNVNRKMVALGIAGVLAGLGILVAGMATSVEFIGVVGFLGMLVGAFVIYRAFSRKPDESAAPAQSRVQPNAPAKGQAADSSGGFMDRMEQRWRKRRDERGDQL